MGDRSERDAGGREVAPRFWKGQDVLVAKDVTVGHLGSFVEIVIANGSLPLIRTFSDIPKIGRLFPSTRSRLAQLGLEVIEGAQRRVERIIEKQSIGSVDLMNRSFSTTVPVVGHGMREVRLEKGTPLFRFYSPGAPIKGEELEDLVSSGEIAVEGRRGDDWNFVYESPYEKSVPWGIAVRITGPRFWIPSSVSPIPAQEVIETRDYREVLNKFYEPIPKIIESKESILWVGETKALHLSEKIDAVIDRDVVPNLSAMGRPGKWGEHIDARLIDAESSWPIRVEVVSPIATGRIPNYAVFRFMHSNGN